MTAELVLNPRPRDIGDGRRRSLGPFVFFDHMGPADFGPGEGIDVRPHPHVCLATITWLFDGEIVHRDSLGVEQRIRPGDVNWMVAGRGIVHSERSDPAVRDAGGRLEGIQSWIALPVADEEAEPSFNHHPADTLPVIERDGVAMHLIAGSIWGETAPARTFSPMFYLAGEAGKDAAFDLPAEYEERGIYVVSGKASADGESFGEGQMAIFAPGADIPIEVAAGSRFMLLGGAPLDRPRRIWWNFVARNPERIEQAKADWREGRFPKIPGDADEFIPLPDDQDT
jgi:redox-sensitive bicupin YhaK (pirin superfamily)